MPDLERWVYWSAEIWRVERYFAIADVQQSHPQPLQYCPLFRALYSRRGVEHDDAREFSMLAVACSKICRALHDGPTPLATDDLLQGRRPRVRSACIGCAIRQTLRS